MTKFRVVTHMGRGMFQRVSHAIVYCTNALCSLSVIAVFLDVNCVNTKVRYMLIVSILMLLLIPHESNENRTLYSFR